MFYLASVSMTGDGAHLAIIIMLFVLVVLAVFSRWRP